MCEVLLYLSVAKLRYLATIIYILLLSVLVDCPQPFSPSERGFAHRLGQDERRVRVVRRLPVPGGRGVAESMRRLPAGARLHVLYVIAGQTTRPLLAFRFNSPPRRVILSFRKLAGSGLRRFAAAMAATSVTPMICISCLFTSYRSRDRNRFPRSIVNWNLLFLGDSARITL